MKHSRLSSVRGQAKINAAVDLTVISSLISSCNSLVCTQLQGHPVACNVGKTKYNLLSISSITTRIVGSTNWPGIVGPSIALPALFLPSRVSVKSSADSSATPSIRTNMVRLNGVLASGPSTSNVVG